MNSARPYAQYLWLAPVAALLVLAAILSHHPKEARYRQNVISQFERAERVELYVSGENEPAVVIARGDVRRFRAVLHGIRDSWVTRRCPAEPDIRIDIYLSPSPPERPGPELLHAYYHTACRQLTLADTELQLADSALCVGPAFRSLLPKPTKPSACPKEFISQ